MPPEVIAAGIAAGGKLGGAILGNRSQNRATDAQLQGNREALAFEREQEARRRQEYDQQVAREQAAWEAQQAQREPYRQAGLSVLARYMDVTPFLNNTPSSPPPGWTPGMPMGGGGMSTPLQTLGTLTGLAGVKSAVEPSGVAPMVPPIQTPEAFSLGGLIRRR